MLLTLYTSQPLRSADLSQIVPEWDARYVDCEQEMLFELILVRGSCVLCLAARGNPHPVPNQAANFMDIKPLLDLSCAKVASMIKNKTPEEIRKVRVRWRRQEDVATANALPPPADLRHQKRFYTGGGGADS